MAKNEFGVESSDSGGFGAGVGSDFDFMFEEANNRSVVDDEVSEVRPSRDRTSEASYSFNTEPETPAVAETPIAGFTDEDSTSDELVGFEEITPGFDENLESSSSFGQTGNLEEMFSEAEDASVVDDEISQPTATQEVESLEDSFDNFGVVTQPEELEDSQTDLEPQDSWVDPAIELDVPEVAVAPETVAERVASPSVPEPVYYAPAVGEPTPSYVPETDRTVAQTSPSVPSIAESDVDYIERVILTSDAIRELPEADAKAVNMFITAGQPVESHQELVLTALLADRQILKTSEAILEAKSKESVDRAFHILGLDETTFVDFGKILSHDLETTETVLFEGDRLRYARKLVDVVEALPAVSIKRFEAVQSVLGAGELNS